MNILALSGSLRADSYNTALLRAFAARVPEGVTMRIVSLGDLPLYNQDLETTFPESAHALKEAVKAADGILIATPEYNRSIPGVLKNALDWTSRPYGDSAWKGKPVYVIGASVGPLSAALAQYDLKKILLYLDAHVLGQPEFYLGNASDKFAPDGSLTDEKTRTHIDVALATFIPFAQRVSDTLKP